MNWNAFVVGFLAAVVANALGFHWNSWAWWTVWVFGVVAYFLGEFRGMAYERKRLERP